MTRTSNTFIEDLVAIARQLRDELERSDWFDALQSQWPAARSDRRIDSVAQALTCGRAIRALPHAKWTAAIVRNLCESPDPVVAGVMRVLLDQCPRGRQFVPWFDRIDRLVRASPAALEGPSEIYFFELFLANYDGRDRTRRGVYYTPPELVDCLVEAADAALRVEFQLPGGLADSSTWNDVLPGGLNSGTAHFDSPVVQILDPAVGGGAFLLSAVDRIHRTVDQLFRAGGGESGDWHTHWNDYVAASLLPRLTGYEIQLPAVIVGKIRIALALASRGIEFDELPEIRIQWRDALAGDAGHPATVVIGNPPFSGISRNQASWIRDLLRGQARAGSASYFTVDGRPLGERKHWLDDDYVKFVRLAQWHIEQAGLGVVALVTNHGYLDNPTFRGMRQALLKTFCRISVVDLHGNRKKVETAPDGGVDEGVFRIDSGIALSVLRRLPQKRDDRRELLQPAENECDATVAFGELWGPRLSKLSRIADSPLASLAPAVLAPTSPFYFFVPRADHYDLEYEQAMSLTDVMPVNTTAPVTARDRFVIAFDEQELIERFGEFRDQAISDEIIRARYFTTTRSSRYESGDTRGWKLTAARRRLVADTDWKSDIRRCWYRPFDRRVIYWSEAMIDWPRSKVMKHFLDGENLGLVARRQMLPTQECNFFWVTDDICLDGLLRSDNRGSESVFPLMLFGTQPNVSPPFFTRIRRRLGPDVEQRVRAQPVETMQFIYALFHSPSYRDRYADCLRVDFPRVFVPNTERVWSGLVDVGRRLIDSHLQRGPVTGRRARFFGNQHDVAAGYPRFEDGVVRMNSSSGFEGVPEAVWEYRIGGHQVCRKWLSDRRGRHLTDDDRLRYCSIVGALADTTAMMSEIDGTIRAHGGWCAVML